ncbi:phosphopantetheine-binding protein [Amylibacter sp.]|nr:phosphopantetheine-binding protein [Amylibacter sp.]MDC0146215.1 phosphopantetheine-binding protein [Amylibacter sp.]
MSVSVSVKDKVLIIIAEQAMLETSEIKLNMSVEDLGLDSLGLVEAIFSIEETFSVNVPFNANDPTASDFDISSVGAIIKEIDKLVMEKSN